MDRIKLRTSLTLLFHFLLLLHPQVQADTVAITSTGTTSWNGNQNGGPDVSGGDASDQATIVARNAIIREIFQARLPSLQDMMVVVCEGLQPMVSACSRIRRFELDSNSAHGPSYSSSSFNFDLWPSFGSNSYGSSNNNHNNNNHNNNNNNNHYGSSSSNNHYGSGLNNYNDNNYSNNNNNNHYGSSSNHFGSGGYGGGSKTIVCHSQTNQSAIYQLRPDSTNYPAMGISAELANDQALRECLFRQIVLPDDPPTLTEDSFLNTSLPTGGFTEQRLWQYQSLTERTQCWILQNFQEDVLFRNCREKYCYNCKDKHSSTDQRQKLCLTNYTRESVWSYCPLRPQGERIIRDRIIIPISCSCQSVLCEQAPSRKSSM